MSAGLTSLNLWTLAKLFAGASEVSNQVPPPSAPHIRKALKAGLVEVIPGGKLKLTPAGIAALAGIDSLGRPRVPNDSAPAGGRRRRGSAPRDARVAAPRREATRCERVPTCLLDALRAGAEPVVELRGQSFAVVAAGKVQARRKLQERAEQLVAAARAEVARAASSGTASPEERRRMVLLTPQRPEGEVVRFEVVSPDRLVPSHRPTDFAPEKRYPEHVQERQYHQDQAEQLKVVKGAQKLNPEILLARTPSALDGPSVVTEAGVDGRHLVLGGNGRAMMVLRAYASNTAAAAAYRKALIARAAEFGLDGATIRAAYEKPILVRVLEGLAADAPRELLVAAVRRTNESLSQQMDAVTMGAAQARVLSQDSVRQLGELLAGSDATLRELMAGRPDVFRDVLQRDRIATDTNRSQWLSPAGALTDEAKDRLEAMFLGLVLGSSDRIKATAPALLRKLERAVPDLLAVRGAVPTFDLIPSVQAAVDVLNDSARRGLSLDDLLLQGELLAGAGAERSPRAVALARLLERSGQRAVGEAFARWSKAAIHDPRQEVLFGSKPTPAEAFFALTGERQSNPRKAQAHGAACPRCAGSGRVVPWAGKIDWCPQCSGSGRLGGPSPTAVDDARQQRLINPRRINPSSRDDKGCSCGKRYSPAAWEALPLVGEQPTEDDDGRPLLLELRNCSCGSTLAVERPARKPNADRGGTARPRPGNASPAKKRRPKAPAPARALPGPGNARRRRATAALESKATSTGAIAADLRRRFGAVLPRRVRLVLVALRGRQLLLRRRGARLEVLERGKVDVRLSAALLEDLQARPRLKRKAAR